MSTAQVSIVIPIWNTEKYLTKCLNSLINQTLRNIEIICVNNGSTDGCLEIIENFAKSDNRIKVITIEHSSISNARNTGMNAASAPFVTFVDSDDWVEPKCYETALKAFENDSDIDIVCWGAKIINENLPENSLEIINATKYHKIKITGKHKITDEIPFQTSVCVWNKLFKKSIIQNNEIISPLDVEVLEDTSFFYSYIENCKYGYFIDKYYYNYVQRKNSQYGKILAGKSTIIAPRLQNLEYIVRYYKIKNILKDKLELILTLLEQWLKLDYNSALPENKQKVLEKASELTQQLGDEFSQNSLIKQLKAKNFTSVIDIINNTHNKIFGNNIIGLFQVSNYEKYTLKLFGIKISFRYKRKNKGV